VVAVAGRLLTPLASHQPVKLAQSARYALMVASDREAATNWAAVIAGEGRLEEVVGIRAVGVLIVDNDNLSTVRY
jgi:hypothetical protein